MTNLECEKCGKVFTHRSSLNYHIENKSCDGKSYDYECKYCHKTFAVRNSMYRHIRNSCKVKKEQDDSDEMYDMIRELQKENQKLASKVQKLEKEKKQPQNINTQNINNGTIINNINNISIVAYGKENMEEIDRDEIIKALKTGFNSTKRLTEVVHFNPKYPKFSNIKRSNFNMKNKLMYHDGTRWVTTSDPYMIDELYNRKRDFIEENIENYQDGLNKYDMTRLQRWLSIDDDDKRIARIKGELRELLFNKKEISEQNEQRLYAQLPEEDSTDLEIELDKIDDLETEITDQTDQPDQTIKVVKRKLPIAARNGKHRKAL